MRRLSVWLPKVMKAPKKLLKEKEKEWTMLAEALIEYETLTGDEIKQVIAGEKIDKSAECPVEEGKRTQSSIPEI